jgi:hypothetical protein
LQSLSEFANKSEATLGFLFLPADAGKSYSFLALHFFCLVVAVSAKSCVGMAQKEADMSSTHVLLEVFF